jgi:hypothetical protein
MMRDVLCGFDRAAGLKAKDRPGHQVGLLLSGAFWFEAFRPRTSGLSPVPPWPLPARLAEPAFEGRFVPDAPGIMKIAVDPSRVFFRLGLGLLQLVGYQFEIIRPRTPIH